MSLALDENFSCIYHNLNNIPAKIGADADVPSTGINLNEAATIKLCPTVALDSHDKSHMNNDIHIGICSAIRVPQSKWRLCCAMCNVSAIIHVQFSHTCSSSYSLHHPGKKVVESHYWIHLLWSIAFLTPSQLLKVISSHTHVNRCWYFSQRFVQTVNSSWNACEWQ